MAEKRFVWVVEMWTYGFYPRLKQPLSAYTTKKSAQEWASMYQRIDKTIRCKVVKYYPET